MSHTNSQTLIRWGGVFVLVAGLVFAGAASVQAAPAGQAATPTPTITQTAAPTATATIAAPAGYTAVVVKAGETLATFVNRYKVSAQAIIAANPALQKDPNLIFPGQVLLIPTTAATAAPTAAAATSAATATLAAPAGYIAVRVQAGETLVTFVNRYKVSAQAIIAANPAIQRDPNVLSVGQVLLIPIAAPTAAATATAAAPTVTAVAGSGGFVEVIVQQGDTLLTYVNRYGVSAAAIIAANPSIQRDPNILQIGQRLRIPIVVPTATKAATAAATAAATTLCHYLFTSTTGWCVEALSLGTRLSIA